MYLVCRLLLEKKNKQNYRKFLLYADRGMHQLHLQDPYLYQPASTTHARPSFVHPFHTIISQTSVSRLLLFFTGTPTSVIYTLSLHDALPIWSNWWKAPPGN